MPKIVSSSLAPSGEVRYSLGSGASFTLGGSSDSHECDDPQVLARATAHAWLTVEREPADKTPPTFKDVSVKPEDDPLSAQYKGKVEDAPAPVEKVTPLAVEAGIDQDKKVVEGGVAKTLAADPAAKTTAKEKK